MEFRCRHIRPTISKMAIVQAATPEDAIQEFHLSTSFEGKYGVRLRDDTGANFSVIEIDGVERISRIFCSGIGRRGGVRPPKHPNDADSIEEVSILLNVGIDMVTGEWIGEEEKWLSTSEIKIPKWDIHND